MKKLLAALAIGLASLLPAMPGHAITLSILPSQSNVAVNDIVSLDISISGLSAANEIVSGFDINLLYNSAILEAISVTFQANNLLGGLGNTFFDADFSTPGNLDIFNLSLMEDVDLIALQGGDSLLLATVSWIALADGTTTVAFGANPDFEHNVVGLGAQTLPVNLANACVNVGNGNGCRNEVPEPGTLFLLSAALLGLAYRRQVLR